MKKLTLLVCVAFVAASFASCKKDYTCTYDLLGTSITVEYNDLKKSEADDAETACKAISGTWEKK